ncbi:MAG TPA: YggT family protein [Gammaproteobacteria bacterium]|nr:YggT family protein [Gammaproteobacteria bacterium]
MTEALVNALIFLISTLADLYVFILIARIILVWVHADYYNPMAKFIAKFTDCSVLPIKRFVHNIKDLELATVLLIILIEILKFFLIGLLSYGFPHLVGLVLLAFSDTLKLVINVFFYAILIEIILSWFPHSPSDIYKLLAIITAPIMRPIRRYIRPIHGFDISPIPVLIGLQLIIIIFVDPLYAAGMQLAFR